jgi:hypothetical protein
VPTLWWELISQGLLMPLQVKSGRIEARRAWRLRSVHHQLSAELSVATSHQQYLPKLNCCWCLERGVSLPSHAVVPWFASLDRKTDKREAQRSTVGRLETLDPQWVVTRPCSGSIIQKRICWPFNFVAFWLVLTSGLSSAQHSTRLSTGSQMDVLSSPDDNESLNCSSRSKSCGKCFVVLVASIC